MYQLNTGNAIESYNLSNELINKINLLATSNTLDHQFILIEFENHGAIEMALGLGSQSLLFYTPTSPHEDAMITCNDNIRKAKSDEIEIKDVDGVPSLFTTDNLVPLNNAIKTLNAFLEGTDFLSLLDWYAY